MVLGSRVTLAMFLLGLALIVFLPSKGHVALGLVGRIASVLSRYGLLPETTFYAVEFTANIVLFVPLGFLLPMALKSFRSRPVVLTAIVGFLFSCGIELLQFIVPGRVSDPRDLVSNTLGAIFGAIIASFYLRK